MSHQAWTIADILRTSSEYLEERGIDSPRRNAESMLGKILALSRVDLYLQHDRPLAEPELSVLRGMLKRRAHHEPLQYILGEVEFCGLTLEVAPGLLVPRPETEELAELAIREIARLQNNKPIRVIDIGTGTGCLAISIASRLVQTVVDAVDFDYEAYSCTERNARRHTFGSRVHPILADLFSPQFLTKIQPPYDVVLSNPPYITDSEYRMLTAEVRDYEAAHALSGGPDGLKYYRRIAELLPELLHRNGLFVFEIGSDQEQAVTKILAPFSGSLAVHSDISGLPRMISGCLQ